MDNKHFKRLIENSAILLKKYNLFNKTHSQYLCDKNIDYEKVDNIKNLFSIGYNVIVDNEEESLILKNQNLGLIRLLLVKSFYSNAKLFKFLSDTLKKEIKNYSIGNVPSEFKKLLYKKTFNERVDVIDIEQLKLNFKIINNKEIVFAILEKSLISGHQELYDFIKPYLDFKNDYHKIMNTMCFVIENYGTQIYNYDLSKEIKKYINKDNFIRFQLDISTDKKEQNFNSFFKINIKDFVLKEYLHQDQLKSLNLNDKQLKNILKKVKNEKEDYSALIVEYITQKDSKQTIAEKFTFLNEQELLTDNIWKYLINYKKDFLKTVFNNSKQLKYIIENKKLYECITIYKDFFFEQRKYIEEVKEYIEAYPSIINREQLIVFINQVANYLSPMTELEKISINYMKNHYDNYFNLSSDFIDKEKNLSNNSEKLKEEVNQWLQYLYEKFPHYINNKATLLDLAKSSDNDMFMSLYLEKYFNENNNDTQLKEEVVKNLKVMSFSNFSHTLQWLAENNLVRKAINTDTPSKKIFSKNYYNYLSPYLIDKYKVNPDVIILETLSASRDNEELFKFILDNYSLRPKTEGKIFQIVHILNKVTLAQEIFKTDLEVSDSIIQECKLLPTDAGNILLKLDLKNKLEKKTTETRQTSQNKVKKI